MTRTGWIKRALQDYRVLMLDSRGNGRSTVVLPQTLARRGDARAQAQYLAHFRADSIVDDCELIRRSLAGPDTTWSVLGQSYGGFCATHYLSAHPEGLREVFVTGGLPPLAASADDYYRATYPVVRHEDAQAFRALSRRRSARRAHPAAPARARRDAADRRPSHGAPLPAARLPAGLRRRHGARSTICSSRRSATARTARS